MAEGALIRQFRLAEEKSYIDVTYIHVTFSIFAADNQ